MSYPTGPLGRHARPLGTHSPCDVQALVGGGHLREWTGQHSGLVVDRDISPAQGGMASPLDLRVPFYAICCGSHWQL